MKMSFKLIVFVAFSLCLLQCKSPSNGTENSSSKKDTAFSVCDEKGMFWGNFKPKGPVKKVILQEYRLGSEWSEEAQQRGYFHIYEPTEVSFFDRNGNLTLRRTIDKKSGEEDWFEEYEYDDNGLQVSYRKAFKEFNDTALLENIEIERDKYGKRVAMSDFLNAPSTGILTTKYHYEGCNVVKIERFYVKGNKDGPILNAINFEYDSLGNLRELYEGETLIQTRYSDDQGNVIDSFILSSNKNIPVNIYNHLGDPISLEYSPEIYGPVTFTYSGYDQYGNWTSKEDSDGYGRQWNRTIEYYE